MRQTKTKKPRLAEITQAPASMPPPAVTLLAEGFDPGPSDKLWTFEFWARYRNGTKRHLIKQYYASANKERQVFAQLRADAYREGVRLILLTAVDRPHTDELMELIKDENEKLKSDL